MMSRATASPSSRRRRQRARAGLLSPVKSMTKNSRPATPAPRREGQQEAVDVEREARRGTGRAEARQHLIVPAPAHQLGAEPVGVPLEVDARVVVESADLAQIEQDGATEPVGREEPVDLRK